MAALRVLLVDDDEDDAHLTTSLLLDSDVQACQVEWASSPETARAWLSERHYDICLMDYRLGTVDGIDLIQEAVARGWDVPFILLTGLDAHEVDVQAMAAGAADYLVKGQLTPALLERSIRYAVDAAATQSALRDSERRLREIAENVQEVFWVWDARAGRLTYLNLAFETVFGRSCEWALADSAAVLEVVRADDRPRAARMLEELAAGRDGEGEFRIERPDGSERWLHGRGAVVRDRDGHVARLVGTARDVTDRRRAEQAQKILEASGRLTGGSPDQQRALENITRAVVPAFADACVFDVLDDSGELQRSAYRFVDPAKEAAVLEMRSRFPLRQRPQHPIWAVLSTGRSFFLADIEPHMVSQIADEPQEIELAHRARPTSCIFAPLSSGSGTLGVILLGRDPGRPCFDAHDLSLAEEIGRRAAALVENAQLYREAQLARERERALGERARLLAEASRKFAEAELESSLLQRIVEFVVEQTGDLCVLRLLAGDQIHLELAAVQHRDPRRQPAAIEAVSLPLRLDRPPFARLLATGDSIVVNDSTRDVADESLPPEYARYLDDHPLSGYVIVPMRVRGRILGTMAVLREQPAPPFHDDDVSLLQGLADRAAMTIDNARLFVESQRATKTRDDVIAVVSHDVANPLNAILVAASLMADERFNDTGRTVQVIKRSAERAKRIMRDLLDSACLDRGGLAVAPALEEVARLVEDGCEAFEHAARAAGVRLEWQALPDVRVLADRERIVQVLGNLIGNALRFTPQGGVISVHSHLDGDEVCFSVSDTGQGVPEKDIPRIFDRYYQARAGDHRGLGLGLAISKALVEAHGGRIWVRSVAGAGATFCFTLRTVYRAASSNPTAEGRTSAGHDNEGGGSVASSPAC